MKGLTEGLTDQSRQVEDPKESRRKAFRYANASLALEGMVADEEQLALQEEVIQGRLTPEQAIAQIIAKYTVDDTPKQAKLFP